MLYCAPTKELDNSAVRIGFLADLERNRSLTALGMTAELSGAQGTGPTVITEFAPSSEGCEWLAFAVTVDGALDGFPWEEGAFDADREFGDALEGGGVGEFFATFAGFTAQNLIEIGERQFGFLEVLADKRFSHDGCRCDGDGAALTFEVDIGDNVILDGNVDLDFIAADGVFAFDEDIPFFGFAVVTRVVVVIDNHFAIEVI